MESIKTHCLIVNYKNVKDFKNLVSDVLKQDTPLKLTVVDQNSNVQELDDYYNQIEKHEHIKVIRNNSNQPLNHVWNWFAENHDEEYLAFLNNDIRIPSNFISDSEKIFAKESNVGITMHVTNNSSHVAKRDLNYLVLGEGWQGWDFTVRRTKYTKIPEDLHWFGGDAEIFDGIYDNDMSMAFIFSSPIVHHQGLTKTPERNTGRIHDSAVRKAMGRQTPKRDIIMKHTRIKPSKNMIELWLQNNK